MKNELKDELKSLNSILGELPHKVYQGDSSSPDLTGWEDKMLSIVNTKEDNVPRATTSVSKWAMLGTSLSIAATLMVVFGLIYMNKTNSNKDEMVLQSLNYNDIDDYLSEQTVEIELNNTSDSSEILEELSEDDILYYLKNVEGVELNEKSGKI